jgi:REP element-mobilizing transposase RayT
MARPLRIEYPGALYHVTNRGNARADTFLDDDDRNRFLSLLKDIVEHFGWICHAYCLMDNHYHLLIETPQPNLSQGMRQLNGVYTQRFNHHHQRVGHLFQGRFKAILVEKDAYLLELARYIVLNPVRAGMVDMPSQYPWSSYLATSGEAPTPKWLTTEPVLSQFAKTKSTAQVRYQQFVLEGMSAGSPWPMLKGQVLLGSDRFVSEISPLLEDSRAVPEIPHYQRLADRPGLAALFNGVAEMDRATRDEIIHRASHHFGYGMSEIARELGLHYSTVSKILKRKS